MSITKEHAKKPKKQIDEQVSESNQSQRFIETARELGCDEDESAFDEMVKKVAKAPPPRQDEKPKAKKR